MKILTNKTNQFIWGLEPGKPNPAHPLRDRVNDARERILQPAQKGNTCWYYALKRIRLNVGKGTVDGSFAEERLFEAAVSGYRKTLTALYEIKSEFLACFAQVLAEGLTTQEEFLPSMALAQISSKVGEKSPLMAVEKLKEFFDANPSPITKATAVDIYQSFNNILNKEEIAACKDSSIKFIEEKLETSPVILLRRLFRFVPGYHLAPQEVTDAMIQSHMLNPEYRSQMSILLQAVILQVCFERYHLGPSSWNPEHSIEKLQEELRVHGPLYAGGFVGCPYYNSPAVELTQRIGDQAIWGWKKGSYEKKTGSHDIVVVGVESLDQKSVFFIDPLDLSDPLHPESQKIYKMSYERFIEAVTDIWNKKTPFSIPASERTYLIYNRYFDPSLYGA